MVTTRKNSIRSKARDARTNREAGGEDDTSEKGAEKGGVLLRSQQRTHWERPKVRRGKGEKLQMTPQPWQREVRQLREIRSCARNTSRGEKISHQGHLPESSGGGNRDLFQHFSAIQEHHKIRTHGPKQPERKVGQNYVAKGTDMNDVEGGASLMEAV